MAGYSSRDRPSGEASQDLYAKVLAVEDAAGSRLVIVTTDLVGITESMRQAVEQQVLDRFELPPAALLMNASHTHSGPEVRIDRLRLEEREGAWIERAEQYVRETTDRIVAAIGQALAKLEPAMLSYTSARCGFAMNRRLVTASGVHGRPNPDGPVDHTVPVLRVDSVDGKKLRAVMFGYACHNTVLGLYDLNGDYAGWAQHYLEEAHPNMTALFVIGCGGDQNPYPRRSSARCARRWKGRHFPLPKDQAVPNCTHWPNPKASHCNVMLGGCCDNWMRATVLSRSTRIPCKWRGLAMA
jgi:hypothetical protein